MDATQRKIDRLVLLQQNFLFVARYQCCSIDDDPMFGAVEMFLEGELLARSDRHAFHLKTFAGMKRSIKPPSWPILTAGRMSYRFMTLRFQALDQFSDVLAGFFRRDEDRVGCRDNDHFVHSDNTDQRAVRTNVTN